MQIERDESEMFRVPMTRDELRILCNAVDEVFETIDEWEIPIRLGADSFGWYDFYGVINDRWEDSGPPDAIWRTITERQVGLSADLIIIEDIGNGSLAAIECSVENIRVTTCWPSEHAVTRDRLADSFGQNLLKCVREVV